MTDVSVAATALRPQDVAGIRAAQDYFSEELVDLGDAENEKFRGVYAPRPEVTATKDGVDEIFLDKAEEYYQRFQGFDYWNWCIKNAVAHEKIERADLIVEFGSGFGNSTLPLLSIFPQCTVIATDISPNLLAILLRLTKERGLADRCVPIQMDAQKKYIKPGICDLVVGSAILHHLERPEVFVERAMEVLRPGGRAIFFEPFEGGYATLRVICTLITEEAKRRRQKSRALDFVASFPDSLAPQIYRHRRPGWRDRNDKWVFSKAMLDKFRRQSGASDVVIYPLHDNDHQFTRHLNNMLTESGNGGVAALPQWARDIILRFEEDFYSPDMLDDLLMEGCIIFRK